MTMIDHLAQLIFNIYEAFTVALYVREGDRLTCLSATTFAKSFEQTKDIPIEGTLPGWVVKHGEPLVIPNFDKDESALGYYKNHEGIKSFLGYPTEGNGVIVVDSKKKYVFTDKEKKILKSFALMIEEELERTTKWQDREDVLEELSTEKRILDFFSQLNQSKISVPEVLSEALHISGGDFGFIGVEKRGKLNIQDVAGAGNYEEIRKECHPTESIASFVMEGGREMLLPLNSGYLREKPLFFPGEPLKARQFFGFPLVADDVAFGVVGFVALYDTQLKENAIGVLRNVSSLLALYYTSLWMKEHLERLKDFDPVTGALQFSVFLALLEKMIKRDDRFSLISVKLDDLTACNRAMGVEFTDNLLRKVLQVVKYCTGSKSFVTRKSGGHFYVAVKGNETFETRNMLKFLHHAISKSLSEEKLSDMGNKVEIAVANFPDDTRDLWKLFDKQKETKFRKIID
ncbi:MAG TPA: GAF domain-containing protein [Syntrophorhabdaceae bacterium]|nr:GAF domain-containing protein [Syntrophorhabdaceae bacterium]